MLLLAFSIHSVTSEPTLWIVDDDGPADFTTIQEAINAANDGDTIEVRAGIYYEHLDLNKSITLVGQSKNSTKIDGSVNGTVVTITRDNVKVTGFTIQNSGSAPEKGVYLDNVNHCNITGNTIANNSFAFRVWNSCNNNTISRNNITDNLAGLYLMGSSNNITGNHIVNNQWGISLYSSSTDNIISNNNIANEGGAGVSFYASSTNNTIVNNNITSHYTGIYIDQSTNNRLYHNNIFNNIKQVTSKNYSNAWDNGVEGNYWSNYTGTDTSNDGIGDSPHTIDASNQDNYPLIGKLSNFAATAEQNVHIISNSTISTFQYNDTAILFNVSGENNTVGFCRIMVPSALINDTFRVFVNGTEILPPPEPLPSSTSTHNYIYFTYNHSTQDVIIIPEFSLFSLALGTIVILMTALVYSRAKKLPS